MNEVRKYWDEISYLTFTHSFFWRSRRKKEVEVEYDRLSRGRLGRLSRWCLCYVSKKNREREEIYYITSLLGFFVLCSFFLFVF